MKEIKLSDLKTGMFVKIKGVIHLVVEAISQNTNKPCVYFIADDGFMCGDNYREDLTNSDPEWNITDVYIPVSYNTLNRKNYINSRSVTNVVQQDTKDIRENLIKIYSMSNDVDWNFFLENIFSNEEIKNYIKQIFLNENLCYENINRLSLERNNTSLLKHINGVLSDLSAIVAKRKTVFVTDTMKAAVVIFEVQKLVNLSSPAFVFSLETPLSDGEEISWYVKIFNGIDVGHNATEESKVIYLTRLLRTL